MAAYGVCLLLVVSFILFEVLDVDGSDFASPLRAAATLKVTDPTPDIRRAPLQGPLPGQSVVLVDDLPAGKVQVQQRVDDARADRAAHPSLRRESRRTLARGLLADAAPSV